MDYVRDGDVQGRSLVFLKAHCPCMDVNWVSFCDLVSVGVVPLSKKKTVWGQILQNLTKDVVRLVITYHVTWTVLFLYFHT